MSNEMILVTGATGAQGGATARRLIEIGLKTRFLTRNIESDAARALTALGAEAVAGDLDDEASIARAVQGMAGVFSVQVPGPNETKQGFALVEQARKAGVPQFVHTSVAETPNHKLFPGWGTGRWSEGYWTAKWDIEEKVRNAGFPAWTVLRPAFIMQNFIPPKVDFMFPHLSQSKIITAMRLNTVLQLISAEDIGAFAAAAFADPAAFHGYDIDLAAESPTIAEIAVALSQGLGREIRAIELEPQEAVSQGLFPGWVKSQEWTNEVGYHADISRLKQFSLKLTSFPEWIDRHRDDFQFS
jgi:uncharacterized protein YbjT (DUF2867 family)